MKLRLLLLGLAACQVVLAQTSGTESNFISGLQSRGMKNLTVDQLVSLKIHGID